MVALVAGAVGVVFGDIGTSPLYTIKEMFHPHFGLTPDADTVRGLLSLGFWSLLLVVTSLLATCMVGTSSVCELAEHAHGDDDEDRDLDPTEEGSSDGEAVKARHGTTSHRGVWMSPQRVHVGRLRPVAPPPTVPPSGWPQPRVTLPMIRLLI